MRIVTAPLSGRTASVEFLPVLPPNISATDRRPVAYETGQGKITFARVAALPADWAAGGPLPRNSAVPVPGYFVEMRLPCYAPLELRPGCHFRLDASVILSDARAYTA